jgi:ATP/maltotriose-dependent transcriptional regulator MalT
MPKKKTKSNIKNAWLSLDESDNNQARYLSYFIADQILPGQSKIQNNVPGLVATTSKERHQ